MDEQRLTAEQERAGDGSAAAPASGAERAWTIHELRAHLETVRATESARYEQATRERDRLVYGGESCMFIEVDRWTDRIHARVATQTAFSSEERAFLKRYSTQKQSWNPFVRAAATRAEIALRAEQQQRHEQALQDALQRFQEEEMPFFREREAAEQRAHEEYIEKSIALEQAIDEAGFLEDQARYSLEDLAVIERTGGTHLEGIREGMNLKQIARVIETYERRIPDEQNRLIRDELLREELLRQGRAKREDPRDAWSMDA